MQYEKSYLKSRISWFDKSEDIILYKEVPKATTQTVDCFFTGLDEMCIERPKARYLIIDLSEAELPTAELRRHIGKGFTPFADQLEALCVFTNKNRLITVAAQFIIGFQPGLLKGMTVHVDLAHCLTKIENVKKTRRTR
jgi:hypothetical protein